MNQWPDQLMRRLTTALVVVAVLAVPIVGAAPIGMGTATATDAANGWAVELSASTEWASDTAVFGAAGDATDGLDSEWDSPATPPAPESHLSVYEVDTDASGDFRNLNVSYIKQSDRMVWEFELDYQADGGTAGSTTLSWDPTQLDSIPGVDGSSHNVTLIVDDREIDMRNTSTTTVGLSGSTGTKSFEIIAEAATDDDDDDDNNRGGGSGGGGGGGGGGGAGTTTTVQPTTTQPTTTTTQPSTTQATTDATTEEPSTTAQPTTEATTTEESTTEQQTGADESNESGGSTPGFTGVTAIMAVIAAIALSTRTRG
jgi:hypothetical protein